MYPDKNNIHAGIFVKEQVEFYAERYKVQYDIYLVDGISSKWNYIKSIFKINRLILKNSYDLIHVHFGLSGIFLLTNPFIKTPTIVSLHGSDIQSYTKEGLMQKISKLVVKRATKTIVLNDRMFEILDKHKKKLIKIPCGINLSHFNTHRKNLHNDSFLIGFPASRNRSVKNFPFFIRVIDTLLAKGYSIDFIEFDNFTREEVVKTLNKLDCLMMTSFSEGSPQIVKEALACNVPIISSNVGDVSYLLKNVSNCYIVNSFEEEKFVSRVEELMSLKPEERKTNGLSKIKELQLDQETITTKLHDLYKSVL